MEICGILDSFEQTEDDLKLKFKFIKVIEIPLIALPVEELHKMIGERIGIIRINGDYRIRKILE